MRTRKKIEGEYKDRAMPHSLIIELLLDIRDLLNK